jgi:phosphomannomutase
VPAYVEHFRAFADVRRPLKVLVDYANAMGIVEAKVFQGLFDVAPLFDVARRHLPQHEANPLDTTPSPPPRKPSARAGSISPRASTATPTAVGFLDEKGDIIPMDMITALIAQTLLAKIPAPTFSTIAFVVGVKEVILENGGVPTRAASATPSSRPPDARKGRPLRRRTFRPLLLKVNSFAESSALAVLFIANLVSQSNQPLSQLFAPIRRYSPAAKSIPRGRRARRPEEAAREVRGRIHPRARRLELRIPHVVVQLRCSNTEPLVRLNLEARRRPKWKPGATKCSRRFAVDRASFGLRRIDHSSQEQDRPRLLSGSGTGTDDPPGNSAGAAGRIGPRLHHDRRCAAARSLLR